MAEPNRREVKISQLRSELRLLGRQFKKARVEEKSGLAELCHTLRKRHRRRGKERARKRVAFISNPFGFMKILRQKRSSHHACTEEKVALIVAYLGSNGLC